MGFALDEKRVKADVIKMWMGGGGNTLVKVMGFGMVPDPSRPIGYCTTFKFINGRTPALMEGNVGFAANTKLKAGAEIFLVRPLPPADQFMYRGYSNTPEGISTRIKPAHPLYPPGAGVPQWEVFAMQTGLVLLASVPSGQTFRRDQASLPPPI